MSREARFHVTAVALLALSAGLAFASAPPAPKVELQHVKGDGFELDLPKAWNPKEIEQNGVKSLMIVPPSGESEYVIQVIPSEAGAHDSAAAPAAIQELRDLVKQLAPAMEPVATRSAKSAACPNGAERSIRRTWRG